MNYSSGLILLTFENRYNGETISEKINRTNFAGYLLLKGIDSLPVEQSPISQAQCGQELQRMKYSVGEDSVLINGELKERISTNFLLLPSRAFFHFARIDAQPRP